MAKILIIGHPESPLEQARGLVGSRAGHRIFWFSVPRADLPGVISYTIPEFAQKNPFIRTLLKPFYLSAVLKTVEPDIVHVHYAQTGLMAFSLMDFHPIVVTVMGGDILPDQGYRGFPALTVRLLLHRADCITSKSEFLDGALERIGNFHAKTRRITWGVDLNRFRADLNVEALRARWDIPVNDLVFFDPRIARRFYNKHVILAAFACYLNQSDAPATLLVAEFFADELYQAELRQQAQNLGIADRVRFIGAISLDDMPNYYALSDVTISVPPSDGLPQTIYEAFACGSFLVMGALPQYAGIVEDGLTARLVPVGDALALADALVWVSKNPEVRKLAREKGLAYVKENADFDAQAKLVNQIYDGLLRQKAN
jgi:glycosyltransferase involved in cell wall biosynthesis